MQRRIFLKTLGIAAVTPCAGVRAWGATGAARQSRQTHTILSCNIRVSLPEDEAAGHGWTARRDLCLEVIRRRKPDLFCCQEVLREQMLDLERAFPEFAGFGFEGPEMDARLEGYQGIAKNPVFFSRDRYEMVSAGEFWLSETPHLPGTLSWDSARARHVNWVRLRERASRRQFRVLNTHLDHKSQPARARQIQMILDEAALYAPDFPQLLAGDFNSGAANPVIQSVLEAGWTDTHEAAPGARDDGNTVHNFLGENYLPKSEAARRRGPIDFIFARGPVATQAWQIIRDSRDGRYPSDHYFIAAEVEFKAPPAGPDPGRK